MLKRSKNMSRTISYQLCEYFISTSCPFLRTRVGSPGIRRTSTIERSAILSWTQ